MIELWHTSARETVGDNRVERPYHKQRERARAREGKRERERGERETSVMEE